jgi:hypothetical protein
VQILTLAARRRESMAEESLRVLLKESPGRLSAAVSESLRVDGRLCKLLSWARHGLLNPSRDCPNADRRRACQKGVSILERVANLVVTFERRRTEETSNSRKSTGSESLDPRDSWIQRQNLSARR